MSLSPGLLTMSFEDYRAVEAISKHGLDAFSRSPATYRHLWAHPRPPSPAQAFGTLAHALVLEPDTVDQRFVVWDGGRRAGKTWQDFASKHEGKMIITADDAERARRAADAVLGHRIAGPFLRDGQAERSAIWKDRDTSVLCKCRPDFLSDRMSVAVDLKTAADATYTGFARAAANFRYHVQAVWYQRGLEAVGHPVEDFVFVAVQSDPPHDLGVYVLDAEAKRIGAELVRRELDRYAECLETDHWPGLPEEVRELELPRWATFPPIS